MACPRCKRFINLRDSYGESQIYRSQHRLCFPCWDAEDAEIDVAGTNDLPETLAKYGPPNDFEEDWS
jgi:glutaredoxin-related protein